MVPWENEEYYGIFQNGLLSLVPTLNHGIGNLNIKYMQLSMSIIY